MSERFKSVACVDLLMIKKENDKEKILLMRRKNTGSNDGEYELPGGHLEENEDLFNAMIRESEEELCINIERNDLELIHIMHHYSGTRFNFVFMVDGSKYNPQIGEPDKCDKLEWFDICNLPKNLSSKMFRIINNVKNKILYDNI